MQKHVIPALIALALISGCPGGGGDKTERGATGATGGTSTAGSEAPGPVADSGGAPAAAKDPVARGWEIYSGTDYSNTGLTCVHCHAQSPADEKSRIYIAHSGHGAFRRGAWKITSQEQLDSGRGNVPDLIGAANACVKADYLNHGEQLIEGEDAAALLAYFESIATDDEPFIIEVRRAFPASGLTPDKENGAQIYERSCANCHDAEIGDLPSLEGANEWLNPVQIMAKVRKLGGPDDWYNLYEDADYLTGTGLNVGQASSASSDENPCGDEHEGHQHEMADDSELVFKPGAMPFFPSDILAGQEVVDVAFYVAEEL
ncbi:c-type cytochrome [bacterium]|nr:c-type cytochrome [bacterium]